MLPVPMSRKIIQPLPARSGGSYDHLLHGCSKNNNYTICWAVHTSTRSMHGHVTERDVNVYTVSNPSILLSMVYLTSKGRSKGTLWIYFKAISTISFSQTTVPSSSYA